MRESSTLFTWTSKAIRLEGQQVDRKLLLTGRRDMTCSREASTSIPLSSKYSEYVREGVWNTRAYSHD